MTRKVELLRRKFYFDEFYRWLIYWTQECSLVWQPSLIAGSSMQA